MLSILVIGDNHFILRGPCPDGRTAREMARFWSLIQIGGTPKRYREWEIRAKEFRENLEWAVVLESDQEVQLGVVAVLRELAARGVAVQGNTGWRKLQAAAAGSNPEPRTR